MCQIECAIPECNRIATDCYKTVWYCLGHWIREKILDPPDSFESFANIRTQPRPGPTEFKERCDE